VSFYKTPNGSPVVAIANRLPHDQKVAVRIDLAKLGLSGPTMVATDERTGQTLDVQDGRFTVPLKGRNYTLVSLQAR
jgi:hypothetical protein